MKLAFFTSIVPDGNPTTGFEIANEAILGGLRDLGHEVVVFGFALPRQNIDASRKDIVVLDTRELENSSAGAVGKLNWLIQAMRYGLPFAAGKLADFSGARLDSEIANAGPFDGYVLNSYQMAAAFPQLTEHPYIYVAHNVEHQSAIQNAVAAGSGLQRQLYRRDAKLLKPLEAKLTGGANFVWTFSEEDITALQLKADRSATLPLYIPQRDDADADKMYDAGLIGTWSWQPNFIGLQWFIEQVVPLVPSTMKIAVAGSVAADSLPEIPHVELLGRVESAAAFLNSVLVVPLVSQGGTGVQLKTIEAFQSGYPCVATSSSLRGIEDLPPNCLRADDPQAFAEALVALVGQLKSGKLSRVDGSEFLARQKAALINGIKQGLVCLT